MNDQGTLVPFHFVFRARGILLFVLGEKIRAGDRDREREREREREMIILLLLLHRANNTRSRRPTCSLTINAVRTGQILFTKNLFITIIIINIITLRVFLFCLFFFIERSPA